MNKMDENEEKVTLSSILITQFKDKWRMLKQTIDKIPDDKWHKGKNKWIYSWGVYHVIETADFYSLTYHEDMQWGKVADIDWKKDSEEEIEKKKLNLTKKMMYDYMDEMDKRITKFLENKSDEDLLKKDSYYWFESIYGKLIYLLRHNSFHIGELAKALRDWDCERFKWGGE